MSVSANANYFMKPKAKRNMENNKNKFFIDGKNTNYFYLKFNFM